MNDNPEKLSWAVRLACRAARCNPHILALSPIQDHYTVVCEAILLTLVAGVSGVAWTAFWAQFLSLPIACALGILAFAFVFLIDQAIGAADWRLTGILRQPGASRGREFWLRLLSRFSFSGVWSFATSIGAAVAMFSNTIVTQLDYNRRETNYKIEQQYTTKIDEARKLYLGPELKSIADLKQSVTEMTRVLDAARQARVAGAKQAETQALEADRELHGAPGYHAGAGPNYRVALKRREEADAALAKADADVKIYEPRLADAQRKLDEASADLKKAQPLFLAEAAKLDEEKKAHLVPARNDALMAYIALQQVYESPTHGRAARYFSWLMMGVLMSVELSYVIVRVWFAQTSVYMAILIADTKLRADQAAADYSRKSEVLQRDLHRPNERPPLQIVANDPPQDIKKEPPPDAAD